MQLNNITKRSMLPLTISGGLLLSVSAFSYTYGSMDNNAFKANISNSVVENLIHESDNYYYSQLSLKAQFEKSLNEWRRKTRFFSFSDQIISDQNFKKIVSMGVDAVPFIIEDLKRKPSPLVWSLNFIYNKTISKNPNTTIEEACKLWVKTLS